MEFKLHSEYQPTGDQPEAIEALTEGFRQGNQAQTLLGVTGSGKTFTMANVIQNLQKPTLVIAHNKTLAAQLYGEFKEFFPENAVEYFVSYYDYYQPEAYVPQTDTYIEKDSSINDEIDKLRLSATASLVGRQDVIVVYEEDLVDMQEPIKIPLPFGGTIWSVDFPVYGAPPHMPAQIAVEAGGAVAATCVPVVNVQALAYRNLKDRIPGVATRNVTRAAVKIAAQQVANHVNTGSAAGDLALMLGVFAFNTFSTVISEADTRAWQTVPEHVHLARFRLAEGKNSLVLRNALTGRACEVALPSDGANGGTRLVWFTDVRGFATVSVVSVGGKGTPTWARTTSLLNP